MRVFQSVRRDAQFSDAVNIRNIRTSVRSVKRFGRPVPTVSPTTRTTPSGYVKQNTLEPKYRSAPGTIINAGERRLFQITFPRFDIALVFRPFRSSRGINALFLICRRIQKRIGKTRTEHASSGRHKRFCRIFRNRPDRCTDNICTSKRRA